jgi:hypothetical protein
MATGDLHGWHAPRADEDGSPDARGAPIGFCSTRTPDAMPIDRATNAQKPESRRRET